MGQYLCILGEFLLPSFLVIPLSPTHAQVGYGVAGAPQESSSCGGHLLADLVETPLDLEDRRIGYRPNTGMESTSWTSAFSVLLSSVTQLLCKTGHIFDRRRRSGSQYVLSILTMTCFQKSKTFSRGKAEECLCVLGWGWVVAATGLQIQMGPQGGGCLPPSLNTLSLLLNSLPLPGDL